MHAGENLFDYLDYIDRLRDGHTQAEIGEKLGWSRGEVSNYARLLDVATEVLEMAREHQAGRVAGDATDVATFNFTEGWFRNSGIYNLNDERQMQFMEWFCRPNTLRAFRGVVTLKKTNKWRPASSHNTLQESRCVVTWIGQETVVDDDRHNTLQESRCVVTGG